MTIRSFTFNPFATNCFVCHDGGEGVIVDPSCLDDGEVTQVLGYVRSTGVTVREILLTHAHIDHIMGCKAIAEALDVGLRLHRDDLPLMQAAAYQAQMFGIAFPEPPGPAGFIEEGETIQIGNATWKTLFTPGHSPGSVSFYDAAGEYVISGDVLFHDSIGRTDLPGGSLPVLMQSIYQELIPLGDQVRVLPGHGPETTVGRERSQNPFLEEPASMG